MTNYRGKEKRTIDLREASIMGDKGGGVKIMGDRRCVVVVEHEARLQHTKEGVGGRERRKGGEKGGRERERKRACTEEEESRKHREAGGGGGA